MKLEVKNENYNRFMKRKEIDAVIEHPEETTPSVAQVQHLIAKHLSASADKTEIKKIKTSKGSANSLCKAFIWDNKSVKDHAKKEEKKEEGGAE